MMVEVRSLKFIPLFVPGCLLAVLCLPALAAETVPPPACTAQGPIANWDAAAQLIAGIGDNTYAGSMTDEQKAAWTDYSKTAASDWNRLKRRYVDRITAWRGKYLQKTPPTDEKAAGWLRFFTKHEFIKLVEEAAEAPAKKPAKAKKRSR